MGHAFGAFLDPDAAVRPWKEIIARLQVAGSQVIESRHRRKDGSRFPVEVNVSYVKLGWPYLIAVVRDINERKRVTFSSAADFLKCPIPDSPACLILDIKLPNVTGLELQESLSQSGSFLPVIFITGHGDIPMSVRAMKNGAIESGHRVIVNLTQGLHLLY